MIPLMKNAFLNEYETKMALADFINMSDRLSMDVNWMPVISSPDHGSGFDLRHSSPLYPTTSFICKARSFTVRSSPVPMFTNNLSL